MPEIKGSIYPYSSLKTADNYSTVSVAEVVVARKAGA